MTLFTIPAPALTLELPVNQTHFWAWAAEQPRVDVELGNYLDSLGFRVGVHKLTTTEYQVLHAAEDLFHRSHPHMKGVHKFADLFTPVRLGDVGFYVQGAPGSTGTRYTAVQAVHEALNNAGWIEDIIPLTTYFTIANGTLWARYQQILGQRALAVVEG